MSIAWDEFGSLVYRDIRIGTDLGWHLYKKAGHLPLR